MKPIKIVPENQHLIEDALRAVNGKATAHAYTSVGDIERVVAEAQTFLSYLLIPKADWRGAAVRSQSGTVLPSVYKYSVTTTTIFIERRSSHWWLVEIETSGLWPTAKPVRNYILTPEQDAIAIDKLRARYRVADPLRVAA